MSTSILEEVAKRTRLEKIELARFLPGEIANEEAEDDFELSGKQRADFDQAWAQIESGTAELFTEEEINKELKEQHGITASIR